MFYLNKSYRDMEEWLLATDKGCQALALPRIPDHTTLQRTYRKLRKLDFEKMKNQLPKEKKHRRECHRFRQDRFFTRSSQLVLPDP
jgi:hypothetical protein